VTYHLDQEEAGAPAMMQHCDRTLEAITTARVEGRLLYMYIVYNHISACLRRRSAVEIRRSQCSEKKQPRIASSLRSQNPKEMLSLCRDPGGCILYCSGE
jgi:hypothetical protein